jgi:hypothetical protein
MPKNTAGGSKHKKGSNSESSTSKKAKKLFENILSDAREGDVPDSLHIGKVQKKLGQGRMEVDYIHSDRLHTVKALVRGSLSGRGKKDAFVDVGSIVVVVETGMDVGVTHEIMGVLTPQQVKDLREEMDLDPRLFQSEKADGAADGIEFETPDETPPVPAPAAEVPEIDIDNI